MSVCDIVIFRISFQSTPNNSVFLRVLWTTNPIELWHNFNRQTESPCKLARDYSTATLKVLFIYIMWAGIEPKKTFKYQMNSTEKIRKKIEGRTLLSFSFIYVVQFFFGSFFFCFFAEKNKFSWQKLLLYSIF